MASIINETKISEMRTKSVQSLPNRLKDGAVRLKNAITAPTEILTAEVNRIVGELNSEIGGKINKSVIDASGADGSKILLSKQEISKLIEAAEVRAKLAAHPIGSIYTSTNDTDPKTLFGGEWQKLTEDAYFKIVTDKSGEYGGSNKEHKLPANALPPHELEVRTAGGGTYQNSFVGFSGGSAAGVRPYTSFTLADTNKWGMSTQLIAKTAPGHNQEPYRPYYYGVFAWVRTA